MSQTLPGLHAQPLCEGEGEGEGVHVLHRRTFDTADAALPSVQLAAKFAAAVASGPLR